MTIPNIKLNSGKTIPQVALGLWMNKDRQVCQDSVKWALEAGYRHFDTAQIYENEEFLGQALKESKIPRDKLFITTKIWNENQWWDDLIPSFEESLKKLKTDYVDLLLLHFPVTELRRPAWRKMEEIYKSGRAKSIGVSNYTIAHLEELLREAEVKPAVNQVELHVFLQQPELVAYCQKQGVVVEGYSPLAHGSKMKHPILDKIAKKHGKSNAQIMIRWSIETGAVPLPKSTKKEKINENIDVFDFSLSVEDMEEIKKLDDNYRTCCDPTHVQ